MNINIISDKEIQDGMNYWRKNYDDRMAEIYYIKAMQHNRVQEWKKEHLLPNLQRCINCEHGKVVYDEELKPKKIECNKGYTLREMIKDYCIII